MLLLGSGPIPRADWTRIWAFFEALSGLIRFAVNTGQVPIWGRLGAVHLTTFR